MDVRNRITEIRKMRLGDIAQGPENWRTHPESQVAAFMGIVDEVGWFGVPLVYWSEKINGWAYLDGNMRGEELPDYEADVALTDFTDEDIALPLASYDPISAQAEADREKLGALLQNVKSGNEGVQALLSGLAEREGVFFEGLAGGSGVEQPEPRQTLAERFVVPPFSVLDARQGYWQEHKRAWIALGIKSELGRGGNALGFSEGVNERHAEGTGPYGRGESTLGKDGKVVRGDGKGRPIKNLARCNGQDLMKGENINFAQGEKTAAYKAQRRQAALQKTGDSTVANDAINSVYGPTVDAGNEQSQTGTSIFDPVLCELAYRWFCPPNGCILDPFAGGSVRGIVAAILGRQYIGIDLSEAQITANEWQWKEIVPDGDIAWIVGDSRNLPDLVADDFDFVFTCPPYFDLEIYSDDERDLSNAGGYAGFIDDYRQIISLSLERLKQDRFACIVVGDIRDKKGFYRNFVSDTITAFQDAGATLYNEAILITAVGSLPIRVGKQFEAGRKLGKTHQNVLVFCKGDPRKATEAIGAVEVGDITATG